MARWYPGDPREREEAVTPVRVHLQCPYEECGGEMIATDALVADRPFAHSQEVRDAVAYKPREMMGKVWTSTAKCEWCDWQAQYTGDDPVEMAKFLRPLVIQHCEAQHPDKFPPEPTP